MSQIRNSYRTLLFIIGITVPVCAVLASALYKMPSVGFVAILACILDYYPLYLPGGVQWSTSILCYIWAGTEYGTMAADIVMTMSCLVTFLRAYHWNLRDIRWFRYFVTLGMFQVSLFTSVAAFRIAKGLPDVLQSALVFSTFEGVNILLFLGVHWSLGRTSSGWSTIRGFNFLSVAMSSLLFVLIGRYDRLVDALLPIGLLLMCFIIMWQQYAKAVKSSSEVSKKYQLIANHTDDLILLVNTSGDITFASPSHARLFNKPLDEIVGQSLYTFIQDPTSVRAALHAPHACTSQHLIRLQFGDKVIPTETKISPVYSINDEIECFIVVSRDISERLRQQEYLLQTEKLAVAGQLAAGIAHEIRNPLTSVMGFLQLLREHFDQVAPESYRIVWSELVRISDIASSLLVLAKPEPANFRDCTLDNLIRDTITLLEGQAHKANVYFEAMETPDVTLHCNPGQLKQVFLNLFKNSIEAMEEQGGLIQISYDVQPESVRIEITDNGPGIPKHLLATLGQPFYTTKEKGTGLGLMVVYNIIQEHHGSIQFDSDGIRGTRVTIKLPIIQS